MTEVNASVITIGDELLIGQTIDTNSAFIATELNKIGIWVKRRIAIGDVKEEILEALTVQSRDCSVIIITGGLGPTADDITKPAMCTYFKSTLVVDESALKNVQDIFNRLGKPMLERNLKQAEVPHNCTVLPNNRGTAPGMWFRKGGVIYICLPGVPHEMIGLMESSVLPKLKSDLDLPVIIHRTLLVAGKGESEIAEIISGFENALPAHIKLAYLPAYGMVRLRLTGKSSSKDELLPVLEHHFSALKLLVKDFMVADSDIPLQEAVLQLLKRKGKTVSTAESCTGGYIAHLITSRSGSSFIYNGSVVSYANSAKEALLGVHKETLEKFGAVSEETVSQMVIGIRKTMATDYGIATSGIMGPDGGSTDKPVGTVWIAVAGARNLLAKKFHFRFDRGRNIELTALNALNMLRQLVLAEEAGTD
jgi:nicotinamide-nucleotide amidase